MIPLPCIERSKVLTVCMRSPRGLRDRQRITNSYDAFLEFKMLRGGVLLFWSLQSGNHCCHLGHGWIFVHPEEGELDRELHRQQHDESRDQQRMAAEFEEVVVTTDIGELQQPLPDLRQGLFQLSTWRLVGPACVRCGLRRR